MSLGLEMAVPVVLFGFVGYQIDRRTGTQSAWMIGGGVLGMVVAFYQLFKRIQTRNRAAAASLESGPDSGSDAVDSRDERSGERS